MLRNGCTGKSWLAKDPPCKGYQSPKGETRRVTARELELQFYTVRPYIPYP